MGQGLGWLLRLRGHHWFPAGQHWAGGAAGSEVSGLADPELFRVLSASLESSASTEPSREGAPVGKCKDVSLGNGIRALLAQDGAQSWQLGLRKGFWVVTAHPGTPSAQCAGAAQKVNEGVCHQEGWREEELWLCSHPSTLLWVSLYPVCKNCPQMPPETAKMEGGQWQIHRGCGHVFPHNTFSFAHF